MSDVTLPKYWKLQKAIEAQIAAGELKPGEKLPPERVLAETFGVSRITVRGALTQLAQDGFVERRQGSGNYVRNRAVMDSLANVHLICVRRNDIVDAFITDLSQAMSQHLTVRQRSLTFLTLPIDTPLLDYLKQNRIDYRELKAVVFGGYIPDDDEIRLLRANGSLMTLIGRPKGDEPLHHVEGKHEQAAYDLTTHMLKHGYQRIAFMAGPHSLYLNHLRLQGHQRAYQDAGLPLDETLVFDGTVWERAAGETLANELLKQGLPDAAIVFGDWAAFGLMTTLQEHGVRVPEDMAVAVGDYYSWLGKSLRVPLCGLHESRDELARVALTVLDKLAARETCPLRHGVPLQLKTNRSCGCEATTSSSTNN